MECGDGATEETGTEETAKRKTTREVKDEPK